MNLKVRKIVYMYIKGGGHFMLYNQINLYITLQRLSFLNK